MNIGIDAGPLRDRLTGVGWALRQNLRAMLALAPQDTFHLFASRPLSVPFPETNVRIRADRSLLPGAFWQQLRLPALARQDRLDCFFGPAHLLPLKLPTDVRAVLAVNDLVPELYPETMDRYNVLVHRLYWRRSLARADAIIAISASTRQDLITRLGIAAHRIRVVHLGVESAFAPQSRGAIADRLRALDIGGDYLLAVGTLEPRKNYELLFQALKRLPAAPPVVIAGRRGWRYQSILETRRRLGLEARVRLLGYVPDDDLVALYNGARLLVQASVYEGFGLPVLQAMACGLPVLAANTSSLPEIGGLAAAYFESGSVESLAGELQSLLTADERLRELRRLGPERAREFTWKRTAQLTLDALT